jgi:hypothetical protein
MDAQLGNIVEAVRRLREQVRWKPGKAVQHLAKRLDLGHLPPGTTVAVYDALIRCIVQTPAAEVWVYRWGETLYPTVVTHVEEVQWLVMLGLDGIMETAFPPEDVEMYLGNPHFSRLGTLEELGV